jgi:hypothetical protein
MALTRINTDMLQDAAVTASKINPSVGLSGLYLEKHFNYPGQLQVSDGTARWWPQGNTSISRISAHVSLPSSGGPVTIRIKKNGISAQTISILAEQTTAQINTSITTVNNDYITVDLTSVGGSTTAENLVVSFLYQRTSV